MQKYLIKNIQVVNEGNIITADVLITDGRIERIESRIAGINSPARLSHSGGDFTEINGEGKYLLPGCIDDQVHFREPGLTHKANICAEAKAAVAGGVTSFMEMPNTVPPAFTQQILEEKYTIAANTSLANYSFYMGTSNVNADEVLRSNEKRKDICGIKIFMGSSTGNLLVDNPNTLDRIFRESELLIATHCEDEKIIRQNLEKLKAANDRELTVADHPLIRNEEACFASSFYAIQIAKKYDSRLHILHISTEKELQLFSNMMPLKEKRITAEVCVHHLHFTSDDYERCGNLIKCNPAIKAPHNKEALWKALLDDRLDLIATDHAPHTLEEKGYYRNSEGFLTPSPSSQIPIISGERAGVRSLNDGVRSLNEEAKSSYEKAPAGLPLVQHSLLLMLHYHKQGKISLEKIAEKMSHAVADCFQVSKRGYIREGYHADLVIIDLNKQTTVSKENILYKCGWSPLENMEFPASITHSFINGILVYENGKFHEEKKGMRLQFNRS